MKVPVATGLRKDDLVGKLVGLKKQRTLFGSSVALAPAVAACTGPCVRLAPLVVRVCRLALLLYYPTHAWAEFDPADAKLVARGGPHVDASECAQLRAQRLGLEFYPVHVRLSKPLFATRTELRLTLAAKTLHAALASLLARPAADPSGSASPLPISFAHAVDLAECNGQPLLGVLPAAMSKHALPLLAQLKVFVAELDVAAPCASSVDHRPVLVEALAAGVGLLEKQHMYGEAVEVLCVLRDKAVFDARLRVGVWDRLSLDYLHATWIDNHRERAAEACRQALADDTADQFHAGFVAIARRLDKLTGGGGGAAAAATAPAVRGGMCGVEGRRVQARHAGARPPSKKAKFVNPDEDGGNEDELEVSVERLAMLKYGEEGWAGVHDEGRAIHALATALCPFAAAFAERLVAQLTCHVCVCARVRRVWTGWEVLFTDAVDAFQSPFQRLPLDLSTSAFAEKRESVIATRIGEIASLSGADLVVELERRETDWARFDGFPWQVANAPSMADGAGRKARAPAMLLALALGGERAAKLCDLWLRRHAQHRGGAPDLFLVRVAAHASAEESRESVKAMFKGSAAVAGELEACFVEVKSHNDRLAHKQTAWLNCAFT